MFVDLKLLYPDAVRPEYQTAGASGMDLHAYIPRAQGRQPEALRIPALHRACRAAVRGEPVLAQVLELI